MRDIVSTRPSSSDPMTAPLSEPMPPMTMTTKLRIRKLSPMPDSTARKGLAITPANPASAEPKANTSVYSSATLIPKAPSSSRCVTPARTHMPMRVRPMIQYSRAMTAIPATMTARR